MLGWLADLFRLAWGLLYWNTRKAWFQRSRGRARCPCQNPSDSGRAFETGCEACLQWAEPSRFRRVCPLLVDTPKGLRCSANTADVRPFWGHALRYYGGSLLAIYLAGAIGVFAVLRIIGYPISIVHVTWPGLWYRVPQARGWFFAQKSQKAFEAGRAAEGLLYLKNAFEFDPGSYQLGLMLAKNYQSGQPRTSDLVFERLLREHPAQRDATAQEWFRALLARGDFQKISGLAHAEILVDTAHAHVWLRALLFATKQLNDDTLLRALLANSNPVAAAWKQLLETELLIRAGRTSAALAALRRPWPADSHAFALYYRINALTLLGDTFAASDLLASPAARANFDGEARDLLLLAVYSTAGAKRPLHAEFDRLLTPRLTLVTMKTLCAHLIRFPDRETFARLFDKAQIDQVPFDTETAGIWFSLLCTAGAVGDLDRLHSLVITLKLASNSPFIALSAVESFFRGETGAEKITTFLPVLPLPNEINYALIEHYAGAVQPITVVPTTKP